MEHVILNSEGKPMSLNELEQRVADYNQRIINDLPYGFDFSTTTLTTLVKRITEQKFYVIPFADYVPVRVGQGAWSDQLITQISYDMGGDFEEGILDSGADGAKLAQADAGITPQVIAVRNWAKGSSWSLFDLQQAAKTGNWDVITAKEMTRKRNWDLGLQRVAFLGLKGLSGSLGLLNQSAATVNTSLITAQISSMTPSQLSAFIAGLVQAFQANCNYTAMPSHFVMPADDFNGTTQPSSASFPIISMIELMRKAFAEVTMNPNFKILPCAYAMPANSGGVLSHERYALYNFDETSIRMDVPVNYTATLASTINGMQYQNAGYGQFTGVGLYRTPELMYFDNLND